MHFANPPLAPFYMVPAHAPPAHPFPPVQAFATSTVPFEPPPFPVHTAARISPMTPPPGDGEGAPCFANSYAHMWLWVPTHQCDQNVFRDLLPHSVLLNVFDVHYNRFTLVFLTGFPQDVLLAVQTVLNLCDPALQVRPIPPPSLRSSSCVTCSNSSQTEIHTALPPSSPPSPRPALPQAERPITIQADRGKSRRNRGQRPGAHHRDYMAKERLAGVQGGSCGAPSGCELEPPVANFNISVNRATYLLLKSGDGTPLRLLSKLTGTKFEAHVPENHKWGDGCKKARVVVRGEQAIVQAAAKLLTEVMIFVGNRFAAMFREASDKRNEDETAADDATLDVLLVPEAETGKIIGCKGVKIRQIEDSSAAFLQMTKAEIPCVEEDLRAVFIVGTPGAIKSAKQIICETVHFAVGV